MPRLFGYQRGGPVGRGEPYSERPNLPPIGPIQDAVDAAVGGGQTPDLPPGVTPGGRYFTDPITGNPMYQPPMPEGRPGFVQAQVMPPAIDLTTGQPKPIQNLFDFNQPPPQTDPVQDAVNQATGGNLAQEIMAYLGTDAGDAGVYNEQYDFNKDGVVDMLDITASLQGDVTTAPVFPSTETEPGMDTTIGPPGTTIDPVQTAVNTATATTQGPRPLPSSYGPVDNWGEPGYTAYDPTGGIIDPVESFVEAPVSPFLDEDPSTDVWTPPVFDVLSTAGAGAGGDPRTDFAPVNDLTEPGIGAPYPGGIIDPNVTAPVTGADPDAPGPDPTYYDYDTGTYTPPVDTTGAVDDTTTTTGGFPDILFEGQIYTDANGVTWISVLGEWREVGPTGDTTGGTTTGGFPDSPFEGMVHIDANNVTWTFVQGQWVEVTPTTGDPTVTDPTVTDPTVTDPTVTDPTVTGESEVDKLNALIAKLEAERAAERAAWEAQTAAATGKYTLTGPSIGYNPYVSGQYQSDPYGAAGVPDLGGITTIPVPAPWQPPTLQPWPGQTQQQAWGT